MRAQWLNAVIVLPFIPLVYCWVLPGTNDGQISLDQEQEGLTTCNILRQLFRDQVFFPGDDAYSLRQSQYWTSQQAETEPACRFMPNGSGELVLAVQLLVQRNITFAVESGGHSSNQGASNIVSSVTIDLAQLSSITLTDNNEAVWLGPAARWSDVYAALEKYDLTVSGGRVGHVGVGGYVLGGGLSWFANQFGWTCDSVLEFEVVTPNRRLLHVREDWNEDLFWALKGSLGTFGIITAIKLPTIPDRSVLAGAISYEQSEMPIVFAALDRTTMHSDEDLKSQAYVSFAWVQNIQRHVYTTYVLNTAGNTQAPTLAYFESIPHIHSSVRNTTIKASANEIAASNPLGLRRSKITLTARSSVKAMEAIHAASLAVMESTAFGDEDLLGVTIQPLTVAHLQANRNIFSIDPSDGPLLLLSAELWWSDASGDTYFETQLRALHDTWIAALTEIRAYHPWLYPNYAAKWQQPFEQGSLKASTRRALQQVREKYDTDDIWKSMVPGIWHI